MHNSKTQKSNILRQIIYEHMEKVKINVKGWILLCARNLNMLIFIITLLNISQRISR